MANLTSGARVLAVGCLDQGGAAGILLSSTIGLHTDRSWRCTRNSAGNWTQVIHVQIIVQDQDLKKLCLPVFHYINMKLELQNSQPVLT